MNKVLLLGYSYIAKKAIISALEKNNEFSLVGIASRSRYKEIPAKYKAFPDYKSAIDQAECDTVYISLQNSAHFEWIKYTLRKGKNVICDKPVFLNRKQAQECVKLAGKKQIIFEATAYLHHPQHKKMKALIGANKIKSLNIQFGFPKLDEKNFRNHQKLGGGCLYDLGPYVVSAGEFYFRSKPLQSFCAIEKQKGIPVGAAITLIYPQKRYLQASIGFGREYRNHLDLWGDGFSINLDRSFTIPSNMENTIFSKRRDREESIKISPSDPFAEMFASFAHLKQQEYRSYNQRLLARSIILESLTIEGESGQVLEIEYNKSP